MDWDVPKSPLQQSAFQTLGGSTFHKDGYQAPHGAGVKGGVFLADGVFDVRPGTSGKPARKRVDDAYQCLLFLTALHAHLFVEVQLA